jgi:hypothetical protein
MDLRKIDFEKDSYFECGGKKFFKTDSLSFVRYRELQKIMLEFGFSATFVDIYNSTKQAIEAYNKHDYFAMSIIIYKIQEGIVNLQDKDDPALRMCALFINEENEDLTKYNESEMKAKIDCWTSELEVIPFVNLALAVQTDWIKTYQLLIRGGLNQIGEE